MKITVYTTNCPQCVMLEGMLKNKGLQYDTVLGAYKIIELGYQSAPLLQVDDIIMSYPDAVRWVNGFQEAGEQHAG